MGHTVTEQAGTGSNASDYDRIGGGTAVRAVVNRFYELVLADPALAPFFTDVDMAKLKRHQALLISQVLGGPADYDGRELRDAHAGLAITREHFALVATHLVTALQEANVDPAVIERLGATLAAVEGDVVTVSAP